ncbi:CoA transferase subunit A [Permianibacter sp. IMCC34836]|uniref:CoA transferase subunit A n=1 Tax=Permianibacter fluminis TaxID=2738515 RepID=UPI00155695E5|nr:CoA transferase subunit A [Permianibacter fluminis]NQD36358.1 CoA transferase subunit A [Permianibacter fluminis]
MSLQQAIAQYLHDGQSVAMEGFTHLIPFAAGHEIIRQQKKNLHLIRMTPDLIYDQLIGMGCASELTFSWGGNPGVGSLHRLRDAVEKQWPQPLTLHEHSHAEMAVAYQAGASGMPCGFMKGYPATQLAEVNPAQIQPQQCPFTGQWLSAIAAIKPDVTILHAQQADADGNVLIRGIVGAAREAALAAKTVIVTVEQQVEKIDADMNAIVLPRWLIAAIAVVPGGAYPSYAQGHYPRDNAFYLAWDEIARDREKFLSWMQSHVLALRDHAELLQRLQVAA